jgi:ADP-ribose pyrophosphatase
MTDSPFKFCSHCGAADPAARSYREFVCAACGFRHFITPIPAACALLLDAQDRILIIRRAHEPGLGKLGLPGGVIEPGETGEMGAARETLEEVGIDLPPEAFTLLGTLTNTYLFQGFPWPTIDLFYVARIPDFAAVLIDPAEVMEFMICALDDVPLEDFAFESNAEAVRCLQRLQAPA